jgi:hypothetical protein
MMHETSLNLRAFGYDRVLFTVPNAHHNAVHMFISSNNGGVEETTLTVYLPRFFEDVRKGAERWLVDIESDSNVERLERMERLIQFRPLGLSPHVVGVGLVA